MKVLHVIPSLWQGDGGPAQALLSMEAALAMQGVEVETAATDDAGRGRRLEKPGAAPLDEGGRIRRYFAKRTDFYKVAPSFARWIDAHARDYDVLHLHALFTFMTTVAARAARRHGVPYIVRPLGTLDEWSLQSRRPLLKQASLRWVEGPLVEGAAAVHFTSELEAQQASRTGIRMRPAVIPLGIALPRTVPQRPAGTGTLRILYLSRLDPKKNLEALLRAVARMNDAGPPVHLSIAGDGSPAYEQQLHAFARGTGAEPHVTWLGRVSGDAKEQAFALADVFALPSHSENFGIAAAEALGRGLPCLLSHHVALAQDVAASGAGVVTGTSPEEVARGLDLMIDAASRQAMSQQAAALARSRYSLEAMGAQLKQLYSGILASQHGLPAAH